MNKKIASLPVKNNNQLKDGDGQVKTKKRQKNPVEESLKQSRKWKSADRITTDKNRTKKASSPVKHNNQLKNGEVQEKAHKKHDRVRPKSGWLLSFGCFGRHRGRVG